MRKSQLAIFLSKLKVFEKPKAKLEQYPLDSESGAEILWNAAQLGDIEDKVIADLGCGSGILGLGALLLGAKKCYFVDKDKSALEVAKQNLKMLEKEIQGKGRAVFVCEDVKKFNKKVETVLENPPFGTKIKHADIEFLEAALKTGKVIYSLHKASTLDFLKSFVEKKEGSITYIFKLKVQLKPTMTWHKRKIFRVATICLRIEKGRK